MDLQCALGEVEEQRSRLLERQPASVTEEWMKANRLKELAAEAAAISARLEESKQSEANAVDAPTARRVPADLDVSLLADPDELCRVFGSYGSKRAWFDDLNSRRWLREARWVIGQGQRGWRRPPLFRPHQVMMGLVKKSCKCRLSEENWWRLLEQHFPKV